MKINDYTMLEAISLTFKLHRKRYLVEFKQTGPLAWQYWISHKNKILTTGTQATRSIVDTPSVLMALNRLVAYDEIVRKEMHQAKAIQNEQN